VGLACAPSCGGRHGSHRRSSERRGTGSACPLQRGSLRGAALPGDLASGPGAAGAGRGRRHGLRAALAGATGPPLQPVRPRRAGRPPPSQRRTCAVGHSRASKPLTHAPGDAASRWRGVDHHQGRGLHGPGPRPRLGLPAARLGGAAGDRLVDPGATPEEPSRGQPRRAGRLQKNSPTYSPRKKRATPAGRSRSSARTSTASG
jgi:hypothetical protein